MNLVNHLAAQKLIHPPHWLADNLHYLTIMGSVAYGVADTNDEAPSDFDLYGFCIPPIEVVFPHTAGAIWGFGRYKEGMPKSHFGVYQQHHVHDVSAQGGKGRDYDLQIYNIVKFVQLCMECNPYLQALGSIDLHPATEFHEPIHTAYNRPEGSSTGGHPYYKRTG